MVGGIGIEARLVRYLIANLPLQVSSELLAEILHGMMIALDTIS